VGWFNWEDKGELKLWLCRGALITGRSDPRLTLLDQPAKDYDVAILRQEETVLAWQLKYYAESSMRQEDLALSAASKELGL
jgi:hypothetical protein